MGNRFTNVRSGSSEGDDNPDGAVGSAQGGTPPGAQEPASGEQVRGQSPSQSQGQSSQGAGSPFPDGFDPQSANVEDVIMYVNDNPQAAQAVLDAETAGKGRKGVTEHIEALQRRQAAEGQQGGQSGQSGA